MSSNCFSLHTPFLPYYSTFWNIYSNFSSRTSSDLKKLILIFFIVIDIIFSQIPDVVNENF